MIISKTPYRVSFFGGGSDYPVWFSKYGGKILSTSINKYCYISARYLPQFFEKKYRIVWSKIELVDNSSEIIHPVVRECIKFLKISGGLEIHHNGDLPAKSGIGSSSSFTVGLLNALYQLKGKSVDQERLASEAIYLEQTLLNEAVGIQDQIAVSHGGFNIIEINTKGGVHLNRMNLMNSNIQELENNLMMIFTGISRYSSDIASLQIKSIPKKEKTLHKMVDIAEYACKYIQDEQRIDIDHFGDMMHETWSLKRQISTKISNQEIDDLYQKCIRSGASGGKLLGAGGGGFLLMCVRPGKREELKRALVNYLEIPILFEDKGTEIILRGGLS